MLSRLPDAASRRGIIGSSTISKIIGRSKWGSRRSAYDDYMGLSESPDPKRERLFRNGHILENAVADAFEKTLGIELLDLQGRGWGYRHDEWPYMILHPDRVLKDSRDGRHYALECKSSRISMRDEWDEGRLRELGKSPYPSEWEISTKPKFMRLFPEFSQRGEKVYDALCTVPVEYQCQLIWYMAIGGFKGVFLGRVTDNDFKWYYMEERIEDEIFLISEARRFRDECEKGIVPEPETEEEARKAYPKEIDPAIIQADERSEYLISRYIELQREKRNAESEMDAIRASLMAQIGPNRGISASSGRAVYSNRTIEKWDRDRALSENPELIALYEKYTERVTQRALTVKAN